MLLAIKIGNTNVGFGICDDNAQWLGVWRAQTRADATADEYAALLDEFFASAPSDFSPRTLSGAILVSVVPPLTQTLAQMCEQHLGLTALIVKADCRFGMKILYDNPRAIGMDRVVPCVAAKAKYGAPTLVIDFGTATTFNVINRDGNYAGGAIAPGLNMTADALHLFTAKLPRVAVGRPPEKIIATNTNDALRAGVFFGYVSLVEGMIRRVLDEMREPNTNVIATGGLANILAPHLPAIRAVDQELTYEGLRIIYEMNK